MRIDRNLFSRLPVRAASAAVLLLALALSGCSRQNEQVFTVRGVVRAPYADGAITIQHEEIPNFMPAMTMPFYASARDVRDLVPGDRVEFEFRVGEKSHASKFRKLGSSASVTGADPGGSAVATPAVRRWREGDAVPAFTLVDQDERPLSADDLRGRFTVVSFIFTRCPVPEFCPLIAKKLQAVQAQLEQRPPDSTPVQLVTITIDPEYDRPAVLRAYGLSLGADFQRWRFATGTPEQVEHLARGFAVRVERNGASLDHTLATALIGPDGRIAEIWRGNAWKPEEVVTRIAPGPR